MLRTCKGVPGLRPHRPQRAGLVDLCLVFRRSLATSLPAPVCTLTESGLHFQPVSCEAVVAKMLPIEVMATVADAEHALHAHRLHVPA